MAKKRIAFFICKKDLHNWNGGINYFKYFLNFLKSIDKYEIIIFTDNLDFIKKNFPKFVVRATYTPLLNKNSLLFLLRRLVIWLFKKDYLIYKMLLKYKIDVLSHRSLFRNKHFKVIGWIQDAQHLKFKKFFLKKNYSERVKYIQNEIDHSDYIFVGSESVKKELIKKFNLNDKFIPLQIFIKPKKLLKKEDNFFYYPAQFWKHKNHIFLFKAFNTFVKKNPHITLICTGSTVDHRFPEYFENIKKYINENNLKNKIIILNNVSFKKTQELKKKCLALIIPSLYEGWNLVVEEARSINKTIILSKIDSHLEQKYYKSIFFNFKNINSLSNILINFSKYKKFNKKNKLFYKDLYIRNKLKLMITY